MNFLSLMSGPLAALMRYGVTAAGATLVTKGVLDGATAQQVTGAVIALIPAVIGALTSTKTAALSKVIALPEVASVIMASGRKVNDAAQVNSAMNDR